jgi:hypothetical protein
LITVSTKAMMQMMMIKKASIPVDTYGHNKRCRFAGGGGLHSYRVVCLCLARCGLLPGFVPMSTAAAHAQSQRPAN